MKKFLIILVIVIVLVVVLVAVTGKKNPAPANQPANNGSASVGVNQQDLDSLKSQTELLKTDDLALPTTK